MQVKSFKSFHNNNSDGEFLPSGVFAYADDLLTEKNIAYRATALLLQTKVNAIKNSIYGTKEIERKIDLLAQQNVYVASLTLLDIATSTSDRSLIQRSRRK